jgi:hypothetical protein
MTSTLAQTSLLRSPRGKPLPEFHASFYFVGRTVSLTSAAFELNCIIYLSKGKVVLVHKIKACVGEWTCNSTHF